MTQARIRYTVAILTAFLAIILHPAVSQASSCDANGFGDDFEAEHAGEFPSKWFYVGSNATAEVVDEDLDSGAVFEGDHSLRINFAGGSGSGVAASFEPIKYGILTFHSRIDSASDDLQVMGIFAGEDVTDPFNQLLTVVAAPSVIHDGWTYQVLGSDTGMPVIFGEYTRFDLRFNTEDTTGSVYINSVATNALNRSLAYSSMGVTALGSIDDTGAGTAEWYVDAIRLSPAADILGDMDGNGIIDAFDVDDFELALSFRSEYFQRYPALDPDLIGDLDGNGIMDAFDVDDFEAMLAGGGESVPEPASALALALGCLTIGVRRRC